MALFQATVQAILDSGSIGKIESQINDIGKNHKVQIDVDQSYFSSQIDQLKTKLETALSNLTVSGRTIDIGKIIDVSKMTSAGRQAGGAYAKGMSEGLGRATSDIYGQIGKKVNYKDIEGMFKLGLNSHVTDSFIAELDRLQASGIQVTKVINSMNSNGGVKITMQGIDNMERAVTVVSQLDNKTKQWNNTISMTAQSVDISGQLTKAFNAVDTKSLESKIQSLKTKMAQFPSNSSEYQTLASTLQLATQQYAQLQTAKVAYETSGDDAQAERAVITYENLTQTLKRAGNEYTVLNANQSKLIDASQKASVSKGFEQWCQNNSKAVKAYSTEIEQLASELQNVQTQNQMKAWNASFTELQARANREGNVGKTFADSFAGAYNSAIQFASAYLSVYRVFSTIKNGINTVIELDNALIDLKKTTTMSAHDLNQFYSEANQIAKDYGSTTKEIIQAAADWSRLGYSSKNESEQMAAFSSQFATISPGMNIESATEALTSIMKAYDVEVEDVKTIMSKINEIGNTQATSNQDISEGLKQAASSMSLTGTSFDQTIALFTSAQEIIQNASRVGNGLKTIAMRIRGRHQLPIYCENNGLCYAV